MNIKIIQIPKNDLKDFYRIYKDYTNGKMLLASLKRKYQEFSNLFLEAYLENKLVGIVFGLPSRNNKKEIILHSIAVIAQYWRKGIGSKLLKRFFRECKKRGFTEISVGAGEGVERFYLKNRFKVRYLRVDRL